MVKGEKELEEGKLGEGKKETGIRNQAIIQTIHLNAPPPPNWIGATTICLSANLIIDNKEIKFLTDASNCAKNHVVCHYKQTFRGQRKISTNLY